MKIIKNVCTETEVGDILSSTSTTFADTYFDENCCDAHNSFVRGYRLGVLMTMEILGKQNNFLGDENE